MTKQPLYEVFVSYKPERYFSEENKDFKLDKQIQLLNEEHFAGCGMGFGSRDNHFMNLERNQAHELAKKAREIKGVKAVVRKQENL